jgi:hypothetical protein
LCWATSALRSCGTEPVPNHRLCAIFPHPTSLREATFSRAKSAGEGRAPPGVRHIVFANHLAGSIDETGAVILAAPIEAAIVFDISSHDLSIERCC